MPIRFTTPQAGDYTGATLSPLPLLSEAFASVPNLIGAWLPESGTGEVTSWPRLIGGYNWTKAAGSGENPAYGVVDGLPVIQYDGNDDMTLSPGGAIDTATEITFGIRAKFHGGTIIAGEASNNFRVDLEGGNTLRFMTGGSGGDFVSAPITTGGVWHTVVCSFSALTSKIDIDGVVTTGAGAALAAGTTVVLGAWAAGVSMSADVRGVFLAASDLYGTADYDNVKTFLNG